MRVKQFFRQYRWELLLLLTLALIGAGLVWVRRDRQPAALPGVPVVYGEPLAAVYANAGNDSAIPGTYASASGAASGAAASTGHPRLALSASFYDFGILNRMDAVQRDFYIINRGASTLVITRAFTTCGCTAALLTASNVPPGAAVRATVTFDPAFHALKGQTVRRGLILDTNDPDQPEVAIWVQATLR